MSTPKIGSERHFSIKTLPYHPWRRHRVFRVCLSLPRRSTGLLLPQKGSKFTKNRLVCYQFYPPCATASKETPYKHQVFVVWWFLGWILFPRVRGLERILAMRMQPSAFWSVSIRVICGFMKLFLTMACTFLGANCPDVPKNIIRAPSTTFGFNKNSFSDQITQIPQRCIWRAFHDFRPFWWSKFPIEPIQ